MLNAHGFQAAEVNGDSADREEVLEGFASGRYNVLCNSMLLTEGWDCPSVDCIVVLRPTKVRSLYCQMVGRGTRLCPGKDHLLLLDFLWHTERHELCHPASLICENEEVAQRMTENLEKDAGCPVDIEEAEKQASEDVVAQREEALAKQLAEMKRRKKSWWIRCSLRCPYRRRICPDMYRPLAGRWRRRPTARKRHWKSWGSFRIRLITPGRPPNSWNAWKSGRRKGFTTPKQIRFLEGRGFQHVGTWQFDTARKLIDRIAANGWRVPADIIPREYKGA